ncbi:catenin delta-1-like isoform X3 [Labeo rohita]|uniref:Catenin delta-1-like isoform X3 n=1 Tax=Labeo rohita TaxID=84645 RepID=A0A498NYZ9_LABRO|nr:catenin delta-1-like isoform X3 [Labeo rohita]
MEIVDHALHALSDEVMVPHSGWERGNEGGEESCKPRHLENVSSERSEARRKLRECSGLVDSLMYIVQSQINCKDVDNKGGMYGERRGSLPLLDSYDG